MSCISWIWSGRLREMLGFGYVELPFIPQEALGVELGDLGGGLALGDGRGDNFVLPPLQHLLPHVPDIGDVLRLDYFQPLDLEGAADPVGHQVGPQVSDVRIAVHRGATRVHLDRPWLQRLDGAKLLAQGVIQIKQSCSSRALSAPS